MKIEYLQEIRAPLPEIEASISRRIKGVQREMEKMAHKSRCVLYGVVHKYSFQAARVNRRMDGVAVDGVHDPALELSHRRLAPRSQKSTPAHDGQPPRRLTLAFQEGLLCQRLIHDNPRTAGYIY
jgi:hypothetical protein